MSRRVPRFRICTGTVPTPSPHSRRFEQAPVITQDRREDRSTGGVHRYACTILKRSTASDRIVEHFTWAHNEACCEALVVQNFKLRQVSLSPMITNDFFWIP